MLVNNIWLENKTVLYKKIDGSCEIDNIKFFYWFITHQ